MKWAYLYVILLTSAAPAAFALSPDLKRIMSRIQAQSEEQQNINADIQKTQQRIALQRQQNLQHLDAFQAGCIRLLKSQSYTQPWSALTHPEQAALLRFTQKSSHMRFAEGQTQLATLFSQQRRLAHKERTAEKLKQSLLLEQKALLKKLKIKDTKLAKRLKRAKKSAPKKRILNGKVTTVQRPIVGILLTKFNETDKNGLHAQGLTLQGNAGQVVRAIAAGTVLYKGTFRDYGGLMIVAAGDKQYIYGGVTDYRQEVGSEVKKGDKLALLTAKEAPKLYLEVRHNNREIDPWPLIKK